MCMARRRDEDWDASASEAHESSAPDDVRSPAGGAHEKQKKGDGRADARTPGGSVKSTARPPVASRLPFWLYLPNLIGYIRVVALAVAVAYPGSAAALRALLLSLALDFIDGPTARYLGMCTQFGDLLDHFTDHATMGYLVVITTRSSLDYAINVAHTAVAFGYMMYYGHYFKHSDAGNAVTRAVEQNNYFNMPSMLWNANTCLIPLVKLSYAAEHNVPVGASTELVEIINYCGALVTLAYTIAVLRPGDGEAAASRQVKS